MRSFAALSSCSGPALGVAVAAVMLLNVGARCDFRWQTQDCIAIVELPAERVQAKEGNSVTSGGTVQDLNRELARKINEEALRDPQSAYAHKFVGIANGKVVVAADNFDEMIRRLRQIEPDPTRTFCVEASRDYSVVEDIWGLP